MRTVSVSPTTSMNRIKPNQHIHKHSSLSLSSPPCTQKHRSVTPQGLSLRWVKWRTKKKWSTERKSCVRWGSLTERERIAGKREVDSDKTRKRMGRPWFAFLYSLAAFLSLKYVLITQTNTHSHTHSYTYTYVYTENCGPHATTEPPACLSHHHHLHPFIHQHSTFFFTFPLHFLLFLSIAALQIQSSLHFLILLLVTFACYATPTHSPGHTCYFLFPSASFSPIWVFYPIHMSASKPQKTLITT